MIKINESTKEIIKDVVIGKKNVKFFLCTYISPGSLPNQDSLAPIINNAPAAIRINPDTINIFPSELILRIFPAARRFAHYFF